MAAPAKIGIGLRRVASADGVLARCNGDLGSVPEQVDDAGDGETVAATCRLGGRQGAGRVFGRQKSDSTNASLNGRLTREASEEGDSSEDRHVGTAPVGSDSDDVVERKHSLLREDSDSDGVGDEDSRPARCPTHWSLLAHSGRHCASANSDPRSLPSGGAGAKPLDWFASLLPELRAYGSGEQWPTSPDRSWSLGRQPGAQMARCIGELGALLQSASVTRVIVLLGAGASAESHLETYVNMEKHYFSVGADGRLVAHPEKPARVPAFTYGQIFGPPHSWQDADELSSGLSRARFEAFKRVSDVFCAEMVNKFSRARPHQGYFDLVDVLRKWKTGVLSPALGDGPLSQQAERKIMVATTNLDKLGVKAFEGLAEVQEMHGDIHLTREHRFQLRRPREQGPPSGTEPEEGVVHKPLVMHFEEDYYRLVRCNEAEAAEERRCEAGLAGEKSFTFRHMKPEVKEFAPPALNGKIDTVVLEIGCSYRVRAMPALRETLLKRGAVVFTVNPCEKSWRVKQRSLASQPILMSKLSNLRVAPSGFGDFFSTLRSQLLDSCVERGVIRG